MKEAILKKLYTVWYDSTIGHPRKGKTRETAKDQWFPGFGVREDERNKQVKHRGFLGE